MPLNITAWEIAGNVLAEWCRDWMGKDYSPPLLPEGWFDLGHTNLAFISGTPPPAAALIALKELSRSKHKHPSEVSHVVMIPRLSWNEEW